MRNSYPHNLEILSLLALVEHWTSFFQNDFFFFAYFHPYDTWSMWLNWIPQLHLFLLHAQTMCTLHISSSLDSTLYIWQTCFSCHTCILRLVPWNEHELQDSIHYFTKLISRPLFMVEVLHDSLMASMVLMSDKCYPLDTWVFQIIVLHSSIHGTWRDGLSFLWSKPVPFRRVHIHISFGGSSISYICYH
jgi:hypothetical protein